MSGRFKKRERKSSKRDWSRGTSSGDLGLSEHDSPINLPQRLPVPHGSKLVNIYVEGYGDIPFWRDIFNQFESNSVTFEINVPQRPDLAKGKKVLLSMIDDNNSAQLLCTDSDFDYLFENDTQESQLLNNSPYMLHTYAYATENLRCYAPSLHNICVKATKNDTKIFDFERFLAEYSAIIYPLFLWYAYSANKSTERVFSLIEFKSSVKLNYLAVEDNGRETLHWLSNQVDKRLKSLQELYPNWDNKINKFKNRLEQKGVSSNNVYLFMQGHTLMDNVVMIVLQAVCEKLKLISVSRINSSKKQGQALKNELSNYNNSIRSVRDILSENEDYKDCFLFQMLEKDIHNYINSLSQ